MTLDRVTEVEGQLICVQYVTDAGLQESSPAVLVNDGDAAFVILLDEEGFQRQGFDPIPYPFAEDSPFSIVDTGFASADDENLQNNGEDHDVKFDYIEQDDDKLIGRQKRAYTKRSKSLSKYEAEVEDEYWQDYNSWEQKQSELHGEGALLLFCESFESPYLTDEVEGEEFPEGKRISLLSSTLRSVENVKPRKYEGKYEANSYVKKRTNEKVRKINLSENTIKMMRENATKRPRDEGGRFISGENRRKKKQAENALRKEIKQTMKMQKKKSGSLKLNEDALFHAIQWASKNGKKSEGDGESADDSITVKIEMDEDGEEESTYANGANTYSMSVADDEES